MKRLDDTGRLASELAGLPTLDRVALMDRWRELYKTDPPTNISHSLLMRAIAYRLQENTLGGLKSSTRRFLEKTAEGASSGRQMFVVPLTIKPGTRLLREWHGVTYEVVVLENGVQCNGKHYRSLSEVARVITGAKWSGPLFFGLKKKEAA